MKAKTLIELMTLSSNLYMLSKDEDLMNKLKDMTEKGKDRINKAMTEPKVDEEGNEIEFLDRLILKAGQAKEELESSLEKGLFHGISWIILLEACCLSQLSILHHWQ